MSHEWNRTVYSLGSLSEAHFLNKQRSVTCPGSPSQKSKAEVEGQAADFTSPSSSILTGPLPGLSFLISLIATRGTGALRGWVTGACRYLRLIFNSSFFLFLAYVELRV